MILIKIFDEEKWAKHFLLSGEMRFSKPSYFHDYEDNDSRRDKKDGLEGLITPVKGGELKGGEERKLFGFKTPNKHYEVRMTVDGDGVQLLDSFVEVTKEAEIFIYSMFLIDLSEPMTYKTLEAMNLGGEGKYCVIVHNPLEFSNRVKKRIQKSNNKVIVNKVEYVDYSIGNKEQIRLNYFTKDIKYEGQNEVRFVVEGKDKMNVSKNYHCGNISDIAVLTKVANVLDYIVALAENWKYKVFSFQKEAEYRFISIVKNRDKKS